MARQTLLIRPDAAAEEEGSGAKNDHEYSNQVEGKGVP